MQNIIYNATKFWNPNQMTTNLLMKNTGTIMKILPLKQENLVEFQNLYTRFYIWNYALSRNGKQEVRMYIKKKLYII